MKIEKVQLARESIFDIKLTPKCWFFGKMAKNPLFGLKKKKKKKKAFCSNLMSNIDSQAHFHVKKMNYKNVNNSKLTLTLIHKFSRLTHDGLALCDCNNKDPVDCITCFICIFFC